MNHPDSPSAQSKPKWQASRWLLLYGLVIAAVPAVHFGAIELPSRANCTRTLAEYQRKAAEARSAREELEGREVKARGLYEAIRESNRELVEQHEILLRNNQAVLSDSEALRAKASNEADRVQERLDVNYQRLAKVLGMHPQSKL